MTRPPLAESLDLAPHPEGGWYRQTWAAPVDVTLPDGRVRPTATLIYFLLPAGRDLAHGEQPQALVPAGAWQRTVPSDADALVSCLVSPGFDFADFELEPDR